MKTILRRGTLALGGLTILVPCALAHPGHEGDHGLTWDVRTGALHPLTGWDHLLAMIAVGLWAAQLGGRARWLVPLAFVGVMSAGAALARSGLTLPVTEFGIAASVLALGLCLATSLRLPVGWGMALVGGFALFHGVAHGAEMPATAGALTYGAGFILTTAVLHALGVLLGAVALSRSPRFVRYTGWTVAACGAVMLVA